MNANGSLPQIFYRVQAKALLVGVVALALGLLGWIIPSQRDAFFRAYLFAWIFWFGMSLGPLAWVMMHHMMGAYWSRTIQRPAEAASLNLWLMAVLFLPILCGLKYLYPWAWPVLVHADPVLINKRAYLNPGAFALRSLAYFAIWIFMATMLAGWSRRYDQSREYAVAKRMRAMSAAGILIFVLTLTLACVDWLMSRDARWFSSIFGFIMSVGSAFSGLLFAILVLTILMKQEPLKSYVTEQMLNDLGNLVFTLVILWAYLNFAQFLISWSGNIRDEVHWFRQRTEGWYGFIACVLLIFHFFFPFFLLLGKQNKRKPEVLMRVAIFLLVLRILDMYWLVIPMRFAHPVPGDPSAPMVEVGTGRSWLNPVLLIGMGGIWLFFFVWQLNARPVLAVSEHEDVETAEQVNHGDATTRPA